MYCWEGRIKAGAVGPRTCTAAAMQRSGQGEQGGREGGMVPSFLQAELSLGEVRLSSAARSVKKDVF